jgi:hypothetical protein
VQAQIMKPESPVGLSFGDVCIRDAFSVGHVYGSRPSNPKHPVFEDHGRIFVNANSKYAGIFCHCAYQTLYTRTLREMLVNDQVGYKTKSSRHKEAALHFMTGFVA